MDVGYTVMCVALMLAVMGHVLFGDFEVTMVTVSDSISGGHTADSRGHDLEPCHSTHAHHHTFACLVLPSQKDHWSHIGHLTCSLYVPVCRVLWSDVFTAGDQL